MTVFPSDEAYCGATTDGMRSLRQGGVVEDQYRRWPADQLVGLYDELLLQPRIVPNAAGDEAVQLVVVSWCRTRRHRFGALAIPGTDQARDIKRAHPSPRFMAQAAQETTSTIASNPTSGLLSWPPISRSPMNHANRAVEILRVL